MNDSQSNPVGEFLDRLLVLVFVFALLVALSFLAPRRPAFQPGADGSASASFSRLSLGMTGKV